MGDHTLLAHTVAQLACENGAGVQIQPSQSQPILGTMGSVNELIPTDFNELNYAILAKIKSVLPSESGVRQNGPSNSTLHALQIGNVYTRINQT